MGEDGEIDPDIDASGNDFAEDVRDNCGSGLLRNPPNLLKSGADSELVHAVRGDWLTLPLRPPPDTCLNTPPDSTGGVLRHPD